MTMWTRIAPEEGPCSICGNPTSMLVVSRLIGDSYVCDRCWPQAVRLEEVPRCGPFPRFSVGDLVRVVRVYGFATPDLLGFEGVVGEIDSVPGPQHNYDVSGRYLNEQMLELAPYLRRPRPAHRRLE